MIAEPAKSAGAGLTPAADGSVTVAVSDSATGAGTTGLTLKHNTSGTAGTNFDVQIPIVLENAAGTDKTAAILIFRWTTATNGSETCELAIRMMGAGGAASSDKFKLGFDGNNFSDYVMQTNGFVCLNNTGFRIRDGTQNGGGIDVPSGHIRLKVYDDKDLIISHGGSGGSGLTEHARFLANGNVSLFATGSFGGGVKSLFVGDAGTVPTTTPTGGFVIYGEAGAAKVKGGSGTVTTFGTAEPHCPSCGRDFAHEWENTTDGSHLAVCMPCMLDEMAQAGLDTRKFAFIREGL